MVERAPTVSVVTPAFNSASTVSATVASVYAQSETDWELIIVDDGSTDGTAAVARRCARDERVRIFQKSNGGLSSARNHGIAAAQGEFVTFLDSDDLLMPDYLRAMVSALRGAVHAGFAYTDAWVFDDDTRRVRRITAMQLADPPDRPPEDPTEFLLEHLKRNFVFVATTVRRESLAQVGGFREELTSLEDYEMWLRMSAFGWRGVRVQGPLALYRRSAGQMSADQLRMSRNEEAVYRMVLDYPSLEPQARALAKSRHAAVRARLEQKERGPARMMGKLWLMAGRAWHDRKPGLWLREPPPEVKRAFGDLRRL